MSAVTARTLPLISAVFPSYAQARAAELAERRLDAVRAQASVNLLRH